MTEVVVTNQEAQPEVPAEVPAEVAAVITETAQVEAAADVAIAEVQAEAAVAIVEAEAAASVERTEIQAEAVAAENQEDKELWLKSLETLTATVANLSLQVQSIQQQLTPASPPSPSESPVSEEAVLPEVAKSVPEPEKKKSALKWI